MGGAMLIIVFLLLIAVLMLFPLIRFFRRTALDEELDNYRPQKYWMEPRHSTTKFRRRKQEGRHGYVSNISGIVLPLGSDYNSTASTDSGGVSYNERENSYDDTAQSDVVESTYSSDQTSESYGSDGYNDISSTDSGGGDFGGGGASDSW
jgi:hypothetical protein